MHVLRRNLLACQTPTVGGMDPAYPLRSLQFNNSATQPPLSLRAGPGAMTNLHPMTHQPEVDISRDWIPISQQRPPSIKETPETNGFFLLLRHNSYRDDPEQYRMHLWIGKPPSDATHWAKIPPFQPISLMLSAPSPVETAGIS